MRPGLQSTSGGDWFTTEIWESEAKDAACIDAVAGMLTGVGAGGSLKVENGTLNGSVYINGAIKLS